MEKSAISIRLFAPLVSLIAGTVMLAVAGSAASAEQIDCAQIETARDRLTCFDQQFPRDLNKSSVVPTPRDAEVEAPAYRKVEPTVSSSPQQPDPTAPSAPLKSKGFFDLPEEVLIESAIAAVRSEYQKKMVFRLDNGQIWLQSSPRELPIRKGDKVTIKNGTVGGFILSTAGGTTTRVQRIE